VSRVLLLATTTGYQTRAFEKAAERLGVTLTYATDRCHVLDDPWSDGAIAVRFHDDAGSVAAVLDASRSVPIDGVVAVGDRPVALAAGVAEALRLPGNSRDAAATSSNKLLMRECLRRAGLPGPWFSAVPVEADPSVLAQSVPFPCVIKPLALSGSRGVMRADDERELVVAFERLRALLRSRSVLGDRNEAHGQILIESFLEGREFAVEGLLRRGQFHTLAVFDKPDPLDGPFFEETIYLTPTDAAIGNERRITDAVRAAVTALGLHHGPIHAECRIGERDVFVLEVAARPIGGLCARALRFVRDGEVPISLEELLLRHALGESTDSWKREPCASGVMMMPIEKRGVFRGVSGIERARGVAGVEDVKITAKPGQLLLPLPEGATYLGFIFARADRPEDVERALRAAHATLDVTIDSEVRVLQSGHG
jgi:biotin carboxylase